VLVRVGSRAAREVLSRGQQKLAAIAMTLAQIQLLQRQTDTTPTLLLDDPSAELDALHLQKFIDLVGQLKCQLVLTSLHPHFDLFGRAERVFHVEQGRVNREG
jgi:DNA replication and repair protein RecF